MNLNFNVLEELDELYKNEEFRLLLTGLDRNWVRTQLIPSMQLEEYWTGNTSNRRIMLWITQFNLDMHNGFSFFKKVRIRLKISESKVRPRK